MPFFCFGITRRALPIWGCTVRNHHGTSCILNGCPEAFSGLFMIMSRFALILLAAQGLVMGGVTVTENTTRRLTFVFEMQELSVETEESGGGRFTHVRFADQNCDILQKDGAVLPGRSAYFGVPQEGSVSVRFVSHATKNVSLDAPPPSRDPGEAAPEEFVPEFDNPWLSNVVYARFSGYRAGQVYIRPFLYDSRTRTLKVLLKGTCTVTFPPAGKQPPSLSARSDYAGMLRALLLNFDIARSWAKPRRRALAKRGAADDFFSAARMLTFSVGDGHAGFNEGTTHENGLQKITGAAAAMFVGDPIDDLALFGSRRRALDRTTPDSAGAIPDGVTPVPLLRIDADKDGTFDAEDYLLAYVTGTSGWFFDEDSAVFFHEVNPYSDYRRYWLLSAPGAGAAIDSFEQPGSPASSFSTFEEHTLYRRVLLLSNRDNTSCELSGTSWIWRNLSRGSPAYDVGVSLPGRAAGGIDSIRLASGLRSVTSSVALGVGGTPVCVSCDTAEWYPVPSWPVDTVRIELSSGSGDGNTYFEFKSLELKYRRKLDMSGVSHLRIFSSNEAGIAAYQVSGLPDAECHIWRIPVDESAAALLATVPASSDTYTWSDTGAIGVQYYVCSSSGVKTPPALQAWYRRSTGSREIRRFRSGTGDADYLIVTDSLLAGEALRLAEHKQAAGRFSMPRVARVDDIYREFSGGIPDPAAIRNFFVHVWAAWRDYEPFYAVLFGNGHYDHKAYLSDEIMHVPSAQFEENCIDGFYSYLDSGKQAMTLPSPIPDIYLGRLPCDTRDDAEAMVDKIVELESNPADYGPWRNRALLVADDDRQGADRDPIASSNPHHKSSEDVEMKILGGRESVEIRKVYLFEYEWNEVYYKPEAERALINEINNGVGIVNYFGHGSDDRWADEGLFSLESISSLTNREHYPVIASFSCTVGRFDKPSHDCLSDLFMKTSGAGASVSIASTRKAYASDNEKMAESFFAALYDKDSALTVGQAYAVAKAENRNKNQRNYALFGDPAFRLMEVTDTVELSVFDRDGERIDTLMALQSGVKVRGLVRRRGGAKNPAFGATNDPATVQIGLYNPVQDSAVRKDGGSSDVTYRLPGTPVFVGSARFDQGAFEQEIFLPRNLFFNKEGVRLVAYAWHGKTVGTGLKTDIIFSGTDTTSVSDSAGPRIMVRPIYANQNFNSSGGFTDRLTGMLPLECEINLYDESGIDIVGTGPDEGLTLEVDGALRRQNINHKFLFSQGDFREGAATVTFEDGDLDEGEHDMRITAQDLLGNVSRIAVTLDIVTMSEFKLGPVYNYPNPVRMGKGTKFYFYHSNNYANDPNRDWYGTVDASIRIYTLSGKLIRVIPNAINGQEWDGTDQYGNQLAPNVYLYRVVADVVIQDADRTERSGIKKLVIRPPR
ncbi:MAG: hypothetical protein GF418_00910 [Chitinivibrionales bacterium]|nr:hypothetical protein [Chitinivibrionales bacterium]MBD3394161.1 hypothetical protein [Chitinivibrionales bacterium]